MKSSRRFNSQKTALSFASIVDGEVRDLREHPDRKSNFKVVYEMRRRDHYQDWYDEASMDGSLAYNEVTEDF